MGASLFQPTSLWNGLQPFVHSQSSMLEAPAQICYCSNNITDFTCLSVLAADVEIKQIHHHHHRFINVSITSFNLTVTLNRVMHSLWFTNLKRNLQYTIRCKLAFLILSLNTFKLTCIYAKTIKIEFILKNRLNISVCHTRNFSPETENIISRWIHI